MLCVRCAQPPAPAEQAAPAGTPTTAERVAQAATPREAVSAPVPVQAPTTPPVVAATPEAKTPADAPGAPESAMPDALVVPDKPPAPAGIYTGTHKLGVNRVTNMARVGRAKFVQRAGSLHLSGRVARGKHWLALSGTVQPHGDRKFVLTGVIEGAPDMAWAGEPLRTRRTQGRFTFEVRQNRPYFRLYQIDGRECVCNEGCGNDFCYIDIEQKPLP